MENNLAASVNYYSDEELLKMVYEFYEWDEDMLGAVQNELRLRSILPDDIIHKKNSAVTKEDTLLSAGKEANFSQQFLGWIGIIGILGIIIGYELYFSKTKSRFTDKEYFKYNEDSRESGRYMFYISLALVITFLFYKTLNYIEYHF